jgi:hypothetical protein
MKRHPEAVGLIIAFAALVVAVLTWLAPFGPVGPSPFVPPETIQPARDSASPTPFKVTVVVTAISEPPTVAPPPIETNTELPVTNTPRRPTNTLEVVAATPEPPTVTPSPTETSTELPVTNTPRRTIDTPKPPTLRNLQVTFLGQDGGSYAGQLCEAGTTNDNVHIHLSGLKTDSEPTGYSIQDHAGNGLWATPCNPNSNWLLYVRSSRAGEADLYFKPFRNTPDNTEYFVTIQYSDSTNESVSVIGARVKVVLSAAFLGQDGESFAGQSCTTGTANDNVHIHLNGLRTDQPVSIRLEDQAAGGVWATPCNPASNWLLYVTSNASNQADIYFKPFRDAPDNTRYTLTVQYSDGWTQTTSVAGWRVKP